MLYTREVRRKPARSANQECPNSAHVRLLSDGVIVVQTITDTARADVIKERSRTNLKCIAHGLKNVDVRGQIEVKFGIKKSSRNRYKAF